MAESIPTRQAYREALVELMATHPRLVCLDTDTGLFSGVDFGTAARRYLNIGIAEHNLMGMAAGLAASGWTPFVNTMAAFATSRAAEAVKVDVAYANLPVRIAATHGGLAAGHLGPTHQSLEDLAVMRALPNMTVVVPADAEATRALVAASLDLPGPLYLRLGRKATPPLPPDAVPAGGPPLRIGVAQVLRTGRDLVIVCCGPHPVHAALAAARELDAAGVRATVLNMHTVKPLDVASLVEACDGVPLVVTVEEHWRSGGLGAAVAEVLSETNPTRVVRVGVPDTFADLVADHDGLLRHFGITAEGIVAAVRRALIDGPTRVGRGG